MLRMVKTLSLSMCHKNKHFTAWMQLAHMKVLMCTVKVLSFTSGVPISGITCFITKKYNVQRNTKFPYYYFEPVMKQI